MSVQAVFLESGTRIDVWARARSDRPLLQFRIGNDAVFQIPRMPRHWDVYFYHHREAATVNIEWDPETIEVSFAYAYHPQGVALEGIELWRFGDQLERFKGCAMEDMISSDPTRPLLHFSPVQSWMNDPNGLCKIGDTWHLFYQFHPNSTDWGPMHWGHATSKDLFNWTHLPVFLFPEQNLDRLGATGGAFSGNAFRDRDGSLMFYYSERLPAYDLFRGYREVQKIARSGLDLVRADSIELVLEERPEGVEHDFRDPKVWWDEGSCAYRMVLGASIHGDPAVLLYGSENGENWDYLGPLYRAPERFKAEGARAVECPDFFPLDGKWVLVMGFVGHADPASGRHNLLYALVGDFIDDVFIPLSETLQLLDFGTDFYAMQSFEADGRQIALAWLFNWEYRKPPGSPYSGEMSLPRELRLNNDRLCMQPVSEFDAAYSMTPLPQGEDGTIALAGSPLDLRLDGSLEDTTIAATQGGKLSFEISIKHRVLSAALPQDDGSIQYTAEIGDAQDLRVIHDRGIIEIFAGGGCVCGTRRNYSNVAPDRLKVRSDASLKVAQRTAKGYSTSTNGPDSL